MEPQGRQNEKEHILVCLSPAPSNARIIQTAAKMARAFRASFSALYVRKPGADNLPQEDKERLQNNIRLAESSGATVTTVYGDDIAFQIAEYARLSDVTKIVIGRSAVGKRRFGFKTAFSEQLIALAPNIDIHIIPDGNVALSGRKKTLFGMPDFKKALRGLPVAAAALVLSTLFGWLFSLLGFTVSNIIAVYMLGVLITAALTGSKIDWVVSSVASVLVFNFLFIEPKYSLMAYGSEYPVTFIIMLAASLIIGGTAEKLKGREREASRTAFRTKILFDSNQLIQKATDETEIFVATAEQIRKLLKRDVTVFSGGDERTFPAPGDGQRELSPDREEIVRFVAEHNVGAGKGTDAFPRDGFTYFPVSKNQKNYGVIAVYIGDNPIDEFDKGIVSSILYECAIALDNAFNAKEKERVAILAKNEQLRADLLRSISHDLRTPLTSISGNASNLLSNEDAFDQETRKRLYGDIYADALWLNNLVENVLSITRLGEGGMELHFTTELLGDVIDEALKHVHGKAEGQKITVDLKDELLLVKIDARLIAQVIINLVDNAIKYTPQTSEIRITAERVGDRVSVTVADDGDGIPNELKPRVFEMFYTGKNDVADSRRSIGLGLPLCRSIVNAHGGEITLTDNAPHGAVFTFSLPAGEVKTDG